MLWKLAWRNLWRHRTRTMVVITAVALSYGLLLLFLGLQDDMERTLDEIAVETAGGNVFVHADDYWGTRQMERVIDEPRSIVESAKQIDGIVDTIPRVIIQGLIETADESLAVQLTGVDRHKERLVGSPEDDLVEGEFLGEDRANPMVIGGGVADRLDVGIGDRVRLTAGDPEGEIGRALFHVDGIVETGVDVVDDGMAWTTLEAARDAMQMEGQLNELAVVLDDDELRREVAERLQESVDDEPGGVTVRSWDGLLPDVVALMQFRRSLAYIIFFALLVVVALAVANTFMMAVMERVRELGLLGALGLGPNEMFRMVLYESLILGAIGLGVGFGLGLGSNIWFDQVGIHAADFIGEEVNIGEVPTLDLVIRSHIVAWRWIASTVFVLVVVVFSSLYPAWKAARLQPSDAMRMSE